MRDINAQEDGMLSNRLKDFERDVDKLKGRRSIDCFFHFTLIQYNISLHGLSIIVRRQRKDPPFRAF